MKAMQALHRLARRSITFDHGTKFIDWPYLQEHLRSAHSTPRKCVAYRTPAEVLRRKLLAQMTCQIASYVQIAVLNKLTALRLSLRSALPNSGFVKLDVGSDMVVHMPQRAIHGDRAALARISARVSSAAQLSAQ
nr:hypothetical protein [Neorhizobium galegae]